MKKTQSEQRIYVACLAAYNAGILHGKWIDCTDSEDEIWQEIKEVLRTSPDPDAEEWAIHDYEGFGSWDIGENPDIAELAEYVHCIQNSDYDSDLIADVIAHRGYDIKDAIEYIENNYQGEYYTLADWAESFLEETGALESVPKDLRYYIDFAAYGRDADYSGDILHLGRHVLWNH